MEGLGKSYTSAHGDELPTSVLILRHKSFTTDQFCDLWRRGAPVVIENVHTDFQGRWTPSDFIREYGSRSVELVNCITGGTCRSSVADFFTQMAVPESCSNVMKLKASFTFYVS